MASLNKVSLIGFLGGKPEFKVIGDGVSVATFNVATNAHWKNKAGEKQERTDWHRVVFYRGLADTVDKYLDKGSQIYLEGSLQNRSYEDADGVTRYVTEIIGSSFQFLDKKEPAEVVEKAKEAAKLRGKKGSGKVAPDAPAIDPDDVPF